jgi:outer membrane protein TolC
MSPNIANSMFQNAGELRLKPRTLDQHLRWVICLSFLIISSLAALAAERSAPLRAVTGALTLDAAVYLALKQNPNLLKAIQQIEVTRGKTIEVRAQALPHVTLNGNYDQQAVSLVEFKSRSNSSTSATSTTTPITLNGTQTSNIATATPSAAQIATLQTAPGSTSQSQSTSFFADKSWQVTVQATQSLYAGGKIRAAIGAARFTEDASYFSLRNILDQTIATVRQEFYAVLLTRALIHVQEESVKLLQDQLKNQQNRFAAGDVPRFNVLQAEVALANQQPNLIRARNDYLIAQYQLAKTLNVDPGPQGEPPFHAVGELAVHERPIALAEAIRLGLERRPFLKVQRLSILTRKEEVKVALAGYKPQLDAKGGYRLRNSRFSENLDETVDGWFFGLTGKWNIFDGLETYGKVMSARANMESAKVTYDDSVHQVELEVQQAYANLQTARETIRSQQKTVEQALESLRLAQERLGAGAGTQLDVLNAQVQLTTARSTELQARANYNTALADFDRVTATDTVYAETFDDPLIRGRIPKAIPVKRGEPAEAR